VVFCESREDAKQACSTLAHWLKTRGLTLSAEKTQIVHLREGFDFLGFHIRHYPAPQTGRAGYRLRITPSKHAIQEVRKKLCALWRQSLGSEVGAVLNALNPHVRGWANYFRIVAAGGTFRKLDTWMFHRALRYTKRTHPRKPWYWRKTRYWGRLNRTRDDT
jgi:RNA-directed DNA polymerase